MDLWPRITIVTPSFNQGRFLQQTIESVLQQNYPNLEYFVVDGGSTDNSVSIIQMFSGQLDWWISEPDRGQSHAINKGFARASGDLLCWINSDDVLLPGSLRKIGWEYIEKGRPSIVHANCVYIDSEGKITRAIRVGKQTYGWLAKGVWIGIAPAIFFRRDHLREFGYLNEKLHLSMDLDIWLKIVQPRSNISFIPDYLGAFRWHNHSKTSKEIDRKKGQHQENQETQALYDTAFPTQTQQSRWRWRRLWKVLHITDYVHAWIDSQRFRNRYWQSVFPDTFMRI